MKYNLLALALLLFSVPAYGQTAIIKLVNMTTYLAGYDGKFHTMAIPDGSVVTVTYNSKQYTCITSVNQCDIEVPIVIPAPSWTVTKVELYQPGFGYNVGVEVPKIANLLLTRNDLKKFTNGLLGRTDGQ